MSRLLSPNELSVATSGMTHLANLQGDITKILPDPATPSAALKNPGLKPSPVNSLA